MSGSEVEILATDEDRARVIDALRGAAGSLGLEELERRMDIALSANSRSELALLVWDLPSRSVAPVRPQKLSVWQSTSFRFHAAAYGLVNGMLVGIWALTDVHGLFWPFFPIAGWGVGLGMNAIGTHTALKHRQDREARKALKAMEQARKPPALTERPRSASRTAKVVVMFSDVVDSTRLAMVIGDEGWVKVRQRHLEMLQACYRSSRGEEVNSQGDGFLARFPSPADAVACSIEVQRRLKAQRDDTGFAPSVRIGVNAGEAVEHAGDVLGTVVNLAARVMAGAEPNGILVTESVANALDDRFKLEDGGLREMKGVDRKVHAFRVLWD